MGTSQPSNAPRPWRISLLLAAILLPLLGCAGDGAGGETGESAAGFSNPAECATCHPRQYEEWRGAMMAYAAVSPVFNALEATGNALTDGAFAADGEFALLCQSCHNPIDVSLGTFPAFDSMAGQPSRDFAGDVGQHGLSCDFCHQVAHADLDGSLQGDGIANASVVMAAGDTKFGPFADPVANPRHDGIPSSYLRSGEFCGACHDVRLPGTDAVTGEGALRLENLFTEWREGPYATTDNPFGTVITCQDCHMSAYPYASPGTYFQDYAAVYGAAPLRRVSTHYFTGVDIALVDFPGQDDAGTDSHGLPAGQAARRTDLLRAACELEVETPDTITPGDTMRVTALITNTGAGHNVPSGFSQERQVWIELTVTDADDAPIYRSGYLVDSAHPETGEIEPDGRLHDEDLENLVVVTDPDSLESQVTPGPDINQRPAVNRGLVNFGNEFKRFGEHEEEEEVFVPFLANHMDNSHSIPPLQTAHAPYDIAIPANVRGPLHITARLRFRPFPPRFLRTMAQARPDLVTEAMVDRNRIVDMAEVERTVAVSDSGLAILEDERH